MSDYYTGLMLDWFVDLLKYYLRTYENGTYTPLEMGFSLTLANDKTVLRKPDLGVITQYNPHQLQARDRMYKGIFNLCIEALSDINKEQITRDTVVKKEEYAQVGVQEYYILYDANRHTEFYQLDNGKYVPIKRKKGGVIQSKVLPDFQFRISDLYNRPNIKQMMIDPVYQDFVFLDYQKIKYEVKMEKQRADIAEKKITIIKKKTRVEQQKRRVEKQKRKIEKQRADEMERKYKEKMLKFKAFCAKHHLEYK